MRSLSPLVVVLLVGCAPTLDPRDQACIAEDRFEPDDDLAAAPSGASVRFEGVLCSAEDIDCVDVTNSSYTARLVGEVCLVIDADTCITNPGPIVAGRRRVCVKPTGETPIRWALQDQRGLQCEGTTPFTDIPPPVDLVDGDSGEFCGDETRDFRVSVPALRRLQIDIETEANVRDPVLGAGRAARIESARVFSFPSLLGDGRDPFVVHFEEVPVQCPRERLGLDRPCVGRATGSCSDSAIDLSVIDATACNDIEAAGCLSECADPHVFRLGALSGPTTLTIGTDNGFREYVVRRSTAEGVASEGNVGFVQTTGSLSIDGDGSEYLLEVSNFSGLPPAPWTLTLQ